jgi:hypothetical protein
LNLSCLIQNRLQPQSLFQWSEFRGSGGKQHTANASSNQMVFENEMDKAEMKAK